MNGPQPLRDQSTRDDEMTAGEFLTVIEALGFSLTSFATWLARTDGITDTTTVERNVNRWNAGTHFVPPAVRDKILDLEDHTRRVVAVLADVLELQDDPHIVVYRNNADFWAANPKNAPLPHRWWRHVAYEAAREVDFPVRITYPTDIID